MRRVIWERERGDEQRVDVEGERYGGGGGDRGEDREDMDRQEMQRDRDTRGGGGNRGRVVSVG